MSTTTPITPVALAADAAPALPADVVSPRYRAASRLTFGRLLSVEARKLVDTLTGRWLLIGGLIATVLVAAGGVAIMAWAQHVNNGMNGLPIGASVAFNLANFPLSIAIAVLSILTITSEWGQRTANTTFVLAPRRGVVLAAKLVVILAATLALWALTWPACFAILGIAKAAGATVSFHVTSAFVLGSLASTVIGALIAAGLGLLWLNTPGAIVSYFVLPMVWGVLGSIAQFVPSWGKVLGWIEPTHAQNALMAWQMTPTLWGQLAVTTVIWALVPAAIGTWRWLTKEVK